MEIYKEIGNNENFSKTQIVIISSKFIKFYIQWCKIDQLWDGLTTFLALKFDTNDALFSFFSNFDLFGKVLENCLMLTFPKTNRSCVVFSYSQSLYFMLVIEFVPDGIKKCIRNCKNMIKNTFWALFSQRTELKSRIDQNT